MNLYIYSNETGEYLTGVTDSPILPSKGLCIVIGSSLYEVACVTLTLNPVSPFESESVFSPRVEVYVTRV